MFEQLIVWFPTLADSECFAWLRQGWDLLAWVLAVVGVLTSAGTWQTLKWGKWISKGIWWYTGQRILEARRERAFQREMAKQRHFDDMVDQAVNRALEARTKPERRTA